VAFAVVAALLVALVWVGNTAGRRYVENKAAEAILQQSGLVSDVRVTDSIFVLSLLRQHFDHVDVEFPAMRIRAGSTSLMPKVDVALDDVVATDGFTRFVAGRATASATLTWSQVSTLAGYAVAPDGTGIVVALTYDLYGIKVSATVTATPAIVSGQLVLRDTTLKVANIDVPTGITNYLLAAVAAPIDLGLPSPFVATSLTVRPEGLVITAEGSNVDVTALG
jgi:hypothetical protein